MCVSGGMERGAVFPHLPLSRSQTSSLTLRILSFKRRLESSSSQTTQLIGSTGQKPYQLALSNLSLNASNHDCPLDFLGGHMTYKTHCCPFHFYIQRFSKGLRELLSRNLQSCVCPLSSSVPPLQLLFLVLPHLGSHI